MVKVAIAGASGMLAREIIDRLSQSGKHEIIGLVRKDPSSLPAFTGLKYVQTTYQDKSELVEILTGVHTVLSFIVAHSDPDAATQIRLIDASIEAGVKRIAPSEWAVGLKLAEAIEFMPWYANKLTVLKHLREVNNPKKVIEYSLFQPGAFMDFLTYPHKTSKHYDVFCPILVDPNSATGYIQEGSEDAEIVFTSINDIAEVVARAIEYEGEWPEVGGITGQKSTLGEVIKLGEKIRGKSFQIDKLKFEDLKAGEIKTDFYARIRLPDVPEDKVEGFSKMIAIGTVVSVAQGVWAVTDEWNKLLPDWKPQGLEEFMERTWVGK